MGSPSDRDPAGAAAPADRLASWKEIAAYLERDVTTVQRWEKREGMPDFEIGNFDLSADGREVVLEQVQEQSDVVLIELPRK